jgi:retron-type reverse transcriptase
MGARPGRSTETALELLTRQIYAIWRSKRHVATLLSLDISGAFDTVNPIRLLDILRKKGLPPWIVQWTQAFITDRSSSLVIQGHETAQFPIQAGVPQGSPLSPILFLFYTSELLELCNQPKEGLLGTGFADDVNLLAYSQSTETNCQILEGTHTKLLKWAH